MIERPWRWCRGWALWQAPKRVLFYVLCVDAAALILTVSTAFVTPITPADLGRFALLAVCAWFTIELTRHIERTREHTRRNSVAYIDTKAVWSFAAVIILPLILAIAIILLSYILSWYRVQIRSRTRVVHRWIFSCSTVLCGTHLAAFVLATGMTDYPGAPESTSLAALSDLGVIAVAGLLRWVVNAGLVMAAFAISDPSLQVRDLFSNSGEYFLELAAAGLGLVTAFVIVTNPFVLPGIVLAMVALHRSLLVGYYQQASRTDAKTGLVAVGRWHEFAQQVFERAGDRNTGMALLIVDLDHFKTINDTYGHPFGDEVLRAVANELKAEVRDDDACGRWGGEEFAIALSDARSRRDVYNIAERIRHRIEAIALEAPGGEPGQMVAVSASIGAAMYPAEGVTTLDELLLAADSALYEAKNAGRNTVRLSPIDLGADRPAPRVPPVEAVPPVPPIAASSVASPAEPPVGRQPNELG